MRQEKQQLQDVSDRYDRVVRVLGENVVKDAVQEDTQEQKALEGALRINKKEYMFAKNSLFREKFLIRTNNNDILK